MSKSLIASVEALKKEPLTPDEVATLQEFQKQFDIDDDDPINVVLALMARSQLIIETAPALLQQKVTETIELHRTNLREQAILMAKQLVADLSTVLLSQQTAASAIWRQRGYGFAAGFGAAIVLMAGVLGVAHALH
jgi:hypothetical protein